MNPFLFLCIAIALTSCRDVSKTSETSAVKISETQDPDLKESMSRGEAVYLDFCIRCHMPSGEGVKGLYPPLANSDWLMNNRKASIHAIKYGQSGEIEVNGEFYNGIMAPMGLTDEEIADVMNYILNSWGNSAKAMVSAEEVAAVEK